MITDELRDCIRTANRSYEDARNPYNDREILHIPEEELLAIADRIDAEHKKAVTAAHSNGITEYGSMVAREYVKLPVDADGEPIHIGDELDVGFVARIVITDDEWPPYLYAYKETPHILTQHFCNEVSHYHAPTIEDVLREFAEKITDSQIPNVHPTYEEAIAEYASKLRLAGEGA